MVHAVQLSNFGIASPEDLPDESLNGIIEIEHKLPRGERRLDSPRQDCTARIDLV